MEIWELDRKNEQRQKDRSKIFNSIPKPEQILKGTSPIILQHQKEAAWSKDDENFETFSCGYRAPGRGWKKAEQACVSTDPTRSGYAFLPHDYKRLSLLQTATDPSPKKNHRDSIRTT